MQACGEDDDDGAPAGSGAAAGGQRRRTDAQGRVIASRNQHQVRRSVGLRQKRKRSSMLDFFSPLTPSPTTPAAQHRNSGAAARRRNICATVPLSRGRTLPAALQEVSAIGEFPVRWTSEDGSWHVANKGDFIWDAALEVEGEIVGKVTRDNIMVYFAELDESTMDRTCGHLTVRSIPKVHGEATLQDGPATAAQKDAPRAEGHVLPLLCCSIMLCIVVSSHSCVCITSCVLESCVLTVCVCCGHHQLRGEVQRRGAAQWQSQVQQQQQII